MPKGPKGQKRPADVISSAVHVMRIATGEIAETLTQDGRNSADWYVDAVDHAFGIDFDYA